MKYFRFVCCPDPKLLSDVRPDYGGRMREAAGYCAYLARMYEFYFPATRTDDVTFLTVCLGGCLPELGEPCLSSDSFVYSGFDWEKFALLKPREKSMYVLELCQQAILAHVRQMHWCLTPFETTFEKIKSTGGLFCDHWKKAVISPDRQLKAQFYFEDDYVGDGTFVDFTDRKGKLLNRVQFTPRGYSVYCQDIGVIRWYDNKRVKIFYRCVPRAGADAPQNMRDYWLVGVDGQVEFHYPRVEMSENHSQALFDLGVMYWDGLIIMQDREKGFALIKKAAQLNYKHALNWLQRNIKEGRPFPDGEFPTAG